MRHRSSVLSLLEENCPLAITHHEDNQPTDRRHFYVGTAAHLFCQAAGELWKKVVRKDPKSWEVVLSTVSESLPPRLIAEGYRFDGGPLEPLPPHAVAEGERLAMAWLAENLLDVSAEYEIGLAVDRDKKPVDYNDSSAYVVALLDVYQPVIWAPDYESEFDGICATDYKTSWQADARELETLQRKIHLILARAHNPDVDFVQAKIVNLRTHRTYETPRYWLRSEEDMAVLDGYWHDLQMACQAAEIKPREARPGVSCLGCPYAAVCEPSKQIGLGDMSDPVHAWTVAQARADGLKPLAKQILGEGFQIVNGGRVGYVPRAISKVQDDAHETVIKAFFDVDEANETDLKRWLAKHSDFLSLVSALNLTVGNLNSLAKVLWPSPRQGGPLDYKECREQFMGATTREETQPRFGLWPQEEHDGI